MTLRRERLALDGSKEWPDPARNVTIPEGRHEVERVPNPYANKGYQGDWIVLKGTLIGASEESWLQWIPKEPHLCLPYNDFAIKIEEE